MVKENQVKLLTALEKIVLSSQEMKQSEKEEEG